MNGPTGHAWLSPSAAHRWMKCPGSRFWEAKYPDSTNKYADWGTAVHWLSACALERKADPHAYIGTEEPSTHLIIDAEMADTASKYIAFLHAEYPFTEGSESVEFIETLVDFSPYIGVEGSTGTVDFGILIPETKELHVVDLKTSAFNKVYAWLDAGEEKFAPNPQLALYALGLYDFAKMLGHSVEKVVLRIAMPRIAAQDAACWCSSHPLSIHELQEFALHAAITVSAESKAREKLEIDSSDTSGLCVGAHCRYCKHQANCLAASAEVVNATSTELSAMDAQPPVLDNEDEALLSQRMAAVAWLENWCKSVRGEVERRLLDRAVVPGWKLVRGRAGNARFNQSEKTIVSTLRGMRLKVADIYTKKLRTPTQLRKLLESPRQQGRFDALVDRPEGVLSVASDTDPREAYVLASPENAADELNALDDIEPKEENV